MIRSPVGAAYSPRTEYVPAFSRKPSTRLDSSKLWIQEYAACVRTRMHATVRFLVDRGIPVCGHIGLTPQSVNQLGGYRVQGRGEDAASALREEAQLLQKAGAAVIVLEAIPASLAAIITSELTIPTIGIGAGRECSGQVLVIYDALGIYPGHKARFVRDFMLSKPEK